MALRLAVDRQNRNLIGCSGDAGCETPATQKTGYRLVVLPNAFAPSAFIASRLWTLAGHKFIVNKCVCGGASGPGLGEASAGVAKEIPSERSVGLKGGPGYGPAGEQAGSGGRDEAGLGGGFGISDGGDLLPEIGADQVGHGLRVRDFCGGANGVVEEVRAQIVVESEGVGGGVPRVVKQL